MHAREEMEAARKAARRPIVLGLLAVPPLLTILFALGMVQVGQWLVVEDPLQPARAIVVLGGQLPFRAIEAARIYRQGLAPEVWLTRGASPAEQAAWKKLGIPYIPEEVYNREILERMGVPEVSICLLEDSVRNTAGEVLLVARQLRKMGGERVILVTSKPHSRRVKATWRTLVGDVPQVEVRCVADDTYHASGWWKNSDDALAVSREFFGLLNVWAGFPIRPDQD